MTEFSNVDEVEFIFGRTLSFRQREMIQNYIDTGTRPEAFNCAWCDESDMRVLTAQMDIFIQGVKEGYEEWPWPIIPQEQELEEPVATLSWSSEWIPESPQESPSSDSQKTPSSTSNTSSGPTRTSRTSS